MIAPYNTKLIQYLRQTHDEEHPLITCYVQYELNPSKIPEFEEYARAWIPLVEKFGGTHHGYYLPHEGPNDLAVCLFSFPSLADYEAYRTKSLADSECQQAYQFAEDTDCIKRYDRHFLRPLEVGN